MGQRDPPPLTPNIKGLQTSLLYLPQLYIYLKGWEKITEIPDQQLLGAIFRPINQVKGLTKGPEYLGSTPPEPFIQK